MKVTEWTEALNEMPSVPLAVALAPAHTVLCLSTAMPMRDYLPGISACISIMADSDSVLMFAPAYLKAMHIDDPRRPTGDQPWEPGRLQREHEAGDMEIAHVTALAEMTPALHQSRLQVYERAILDDGRYSFRRSELPAEGFSSYLVDQFWDIRSDLTEGKSPELWHDLGAVAATLAGGMVVEAEERLDVNAIISAAWVLQESTGMREM